jgi:hypothetical protein
MMKWLFLFLANTVLLLAGDATSVSSAQYLGSNPLQGMKTFAINAVYVPSEKLQKEINEEIVKNLEKIGQVEKLELSSKKMDQTIQNFARIGASEGRLAVKVDSIQSLGDSSLPVLETSLYLTTAVTIKKTGADSLVNAWLANAFIPGSLDQKNAKSIISAVKTVMEQFVRDYQAVNKETKERPIFYLFSD